MIIGRFQNPEARVILFSFSRLLYNDIYWSSWRSWYAWIMGKQIIIFWSLSFDRLKVPIVFALIFFHPFYLKVLFLHFLSLNIYLFLLIIYKEFEWWDFMDISFYFRYSLLTFTFSYGKFIKNLMWLFPWLFIQINIIFRYIKNFFLFYHWIESVLRQLRKINHFFLRLWWLVFWC